MPNFAPPDSQKAGERPISFLLDDQSTGVTPPEAFVDLVIRPEELTRTDPSRINVQQTLAGAWADSFGAGIPQITISGHTGWRRTASSDEDGVERFLNLKDQVFDQWHAKRALAIARGIDPNSVRLVFSDALDGFSVVVAPLNFVLRRSKSRPLLAQYQITMAVLETNPGVVILSGDDEEDADVLEELGLDSMDASIEEIEDMMPDVGTMLPDELADLADPLGAMMGQTTALYSQVSLAVAAGNPLAGALGGMASLTAQAGMNVLRSLPGIGNFAQDALAGIMTLAGAYSNIFCVLNNALGGRVLIQDFSALFGASNCSSTSGGRPPSLFAAAGVNPFYSVVPSAAALPIVLTGEAQTAFRTFASADTVLAPISSTAMSAGLGAIASGFSIG